MKCKKTPLLAAVLVLAGLSAAQSAEDTDVAFIEYKYMVPSTDRLKSSTPPDNNIKTTHHNLNTKMSIPLFKTETENPVRIFTILSYELFHASYHETGTGDDPLKSIETLHALKGALASYVPLGNHSGMYFELGGSVNTDLSKIKDIDSKDVIATGNLVFNHTYKNFNFRFGLTSTSNLGKPMILPIGGFTWKPVSWFKYKLMIPHETSAWFRYKKFHAGLFARIKGNQFRLMRNDAADDYSVSLTMIETGLGFRFNAWKKMHIYSDLGFHAYRSLTVYECDGSKSSSVAYSKDFSDIFFLRIGIAYSAI